jgi:ribosome-associated protein
MSTNELLDKKIEENKIPEEYIELNTFIKLQGLAATGGQAKILIRSGAIKVNGTLETRNKKKLQESDVVEYEEKKYIVKI